MLPNHLVELPNFTAEERGDLFQILDLMKIEHTIVITFCVQANHAADHEAMMAIISEFIRGRKDKT